MSFLKKFKLLPILCTFVLTVMGLSGCNEKHVHTYSNDWEYSETLHWHASTCDHADERKDIEAHVFDHACDATCNICGYVRTPSPHIYSDDCDTTCAICNHVREVDEHTYTNDCDATCNECGEERTPSPHVYDNGCDHDCNVCHEERTPYPHVYDNDCDTTCNECGEARQVDGHTYCNDCDTTCNECGEERTPSAHIYDHECDDSCNECGHTRIVEEHVWSTDYKHEDEGVHWRYCVNCDIRGPRETCLYDQQVAEDKYLHTAPTNSTKGIYYYSCVCGAASDTLTFELDKLNPHLVYFNRTKTYDGLPATPFYRMQGDGELVFEYRRLGETEYSTEVPVDVGKYEVKLTVLETPIYRTSTVYGQYHIEPIELSLDLSTYTIVAIQDSDAPGIITLDDTFEGILPGESVDVAVLPSDDSTIGAQELGVTSVTSQNGNYKVTSTDETAKFIIRRSGETYLTIEVALEYNGYYRIHGGVTGGDLVLGDKLTVPGLDFVFEFNQLRDGTNNDAGGIVESGDSVMVISTLKVEEMSAEYVDILTNYIKRGTVLTVNNDIEYRDTYLTNFYFKTEAEGGRKTPVYWSTYRPSVTLYDGTARSIIIKAAYGTSDEGWINPGEEVQLLIQFVKNNDDDTPVKTIIKPGVHTIEFVESDNTVAEGTISYFHKQLESTYLDAAFTGISGGAINDTYNYFINVETNMTLSMFSFYATEQALIYGGTAIGNITSKFSITIIEVLEDSFVEHKGTLQSDGKFLLDGTSVALTLSGGHTYFIQVELLQAIDLFYMGIV